MPFTKKISGKKKNLALAICAALMAGAVSIAPTAEANPVLDAKDAAVSISGLNTANMTVTSGAENNLIKWVDFSIKSGEKVTFDANNYLNYVTGHARSDILGTLTGGGSIYLVNPNGILIGDGATVNVGSLYLSTKELSAANLADYATATSALSSASIGTGDVINMGNLNATVISVEGNNITFKNVADVNNGNAANVTLTANSTGEIHIGSETGDASGYTTNGATYNYKLVNDATDLQNMSTDLAGNYMLAKDVTAGNFTPLGTFTGRFDGLNHKINNLTINSDAQYVGLFGWNQGVIENVGLVGGSVKGTGCADSFFPFVGGIAGNNTGTIRNVYNTGSVSGESSNADVYVGGIAGVNGGTIECSYNRGDVSAFSYQKTGYVGGIAGSNSGTIRQVFNTGAVARESTQNGADSVVGGIAGRNYGNIRNAYNTGAITGKVTAIINRATLQAGGIVGLNYVLSTNVGTVENVYNAGTVAGIGDSAMGRAPVTVNIGGLIGENKSGTLTNGYSKENVVTASALHGASKVTINQGETVGANSGTTSNVAAKTEAELKQAATFAGFGFGNGVSSDGAWRIYEDSTMPLLAAFLTRKDKISTTEYNGTATGDVGATYAATTYNGVENQLSGANYINDVSIVTPKDLTVSFAASPDKVYDGTTTATAGTATLTGIVGTDDVSLATGVTANYEDKNAGTNKQVDYTGVALTGDAAKNYNLTNAATATGTGTITAKEISATFADITKTYDGTKNATAGTGTLTGVITGDTVNVSGTAAFADRNAGTNKTVNYTDVTLSGTDAANYTIANTATGNGSIAKADITISTNAVTKTYDGTTSATGVAIVTSGQIFGTDKIGEGTFTFTDKNAGTNKTVTVSNVTVIDGNNGGNYNVTYAANTASTINRKEAPVIFNPITKTYDGTTSATPGTATFLDLIGADKGKVGVTADAAYEDMNVGTGKRVKYTNITLTGAEAQNYYLTQTDFNADNGTITRKALELVATPVTIAEGEATPTAWSGSVTGFVAGEGLDGGDTLSFALDDPTAAAIGKYSVTGTLSIGGGEAKTSGDYGTNYTFANAASNATAFTIAAKYVPPAPTPTPTPTPSNDNSNNSSGSNNNTINYVVPVTPVTPSGGTATPIVPADNSPAPVSAENSPTTIGDIIPEMSGTPAGNLPVGTVAEAERQAAVATRTEMDNIPNKNFAVYAEYFAPPVNAESSQQLIWAPGGAFALANYGIHLPAPVTLEINANKLIFRRLDATSGSLHDAIISTAGQADLALGTEESDKKRDAAASESTTR